VLVIMRKNHALQILPTLAANGRTPNVLFLMNNAAGPGELIEALGRRRVLIGFPGAAGYREGHVVHYLAGTAEEPWPIYLGEADGRTTARTTAVAQIIGGGLGFEAQIRPDMDTWLKYHVALLMPSLAPALYAAALDHRRLARTRDLIVLAIRAIREGFQVLTALGYPVSPPRYRVLRWIPEPILVLLFRALLLRVVPEEMIEAALLRHARSARDEVKHLTDEFLALARTTSVPTPAIERLYPYLDAEMALVPEGRAEIPLRWDGLWIGVAAVLAGVILVRWFRGRRKEETRRGKRSYRPATCWSRWC
jgi:2-dehydropantoate 2-reductase